MKVFNIGRWKNLWNNACLSTNRDTPTIIEILGNPRMSTLNCNISVIQLIFEQGHRHAVFVNLENIQALLVLQVQLFLSVTIHLTKNVPGASNNISCIACLAGSYCSPGTMPTKQYVVNQLSRWLLLLPYYHAGYYYYLTYLVFWVLADCLRTEFENGFFQVLKMQPSVLLVIIVLKLACLSHWRVLWGISVPIKACQLLYHVLWVVTAHIWTCLRLSYALQASFVRPLFFPAQWRVRLGTFALEGTIQLPHCVLLDIIAQQLI